MKTALALATFSLPPVIFTSLGVPHGAAAGILLSAALAWLFEIVPVGVTGLLIPVLGALWGILPAQKAFSYFGTDLIFLLCSVCLFARAFAKCGLGERLAYWAVLHPLVGSSLRRAVYALTFMCWCISMWMSNGAACSILLTLTLGLLSVMQPHLADGEYSTLSKRLLFLCSMTPGLSGLATPVGGAPNLLAFRYFADHGQPISMLDWFLLAAPASVVLVLLSVAVLDWMFPTPDFNLDTIREQLLEKRTLLGVLSRDEKVVACVGLLLIFLWVVAPQLTHLFSPGSSVYRGLSRLTPTMAAVGCVAVLFMVARQGNREESLLSHHDLPAADISTLFLLGGGLALGGIIEESGLAASLAQGLTHVVVTYPLLSGTALACATLLLSEFCSNTAAVALLLPIVFSISSNPEAEGDVMRLSLITLFAATLGFCMPAGTLPNSLVYSTGRVSVRDMASAGIWIDILGVVVVVVLLEWLYPWLGLL